VLAADQEGKPEGDAALAFCDKLIEKWGITEVEMGAVEAVRRDILNRGGLEVWRVLLLAVLAGEFECESSHNQETGVSHLYGEEDALAKVHDAYDYVIEWISVGYQAWLPRASGPVLHALAMVRLSPEEAYCSAAVRSFLNRLHQSTVARQAREEAPHDPYAALRNSPSYNHAGANASQNHTSWGPGD